MIEPRAVAIPAGAADRGTGRQREVSFLLRRQGSVAKSTQAGIPWLRFIRQRLGSASISGRSMAGTFRPGDRPSPRSIRRCGRAALPVKTP
jgi:hypothetical protein